MLNQPEPDWKELCYLWASDFSHPSDRQTLGGFRARLEAAEAKHSHPVPPAVSVPATEPSTDRHLNIETPMISARLDRRRGLALERLRFEGNEHAVMGGIAHGTFEEIGLQADWYTGDCVFEAPGEPRSPIWNGAMPEFTDWKTETSSPMPASTRPRAGSKSRCVFPATNAASTSTSRSIGPTGARVSCGWAISPCCPMLFFWTGSGWPQPMVVGGRVSPCPAAQSTMVRPVSFLVSSSHGLGMTEGWAEIGDDKTHLRIEVDRCTAPLMVC